MTKESLKIISDALEEIGINYEFMEWTSEIVYPYFVGEYTETEPFNEDGMQESAFILQGFTKGGWGDLESAKQTIREHFINGYKELSESGSFVAVFYANSYPTQTGDAELKKIEIVLNVKEWSVI